jgi:hypothetical protein
MFSNAIFICQIMAIISDDQAPDIYIKHDYWDNSYVSLYVNSSVCSLWNIILLFRVELRLVLQENKPVPVVNAKHIYQFIVLQYYSPFLFLDFVSFAWSKDFKSCCVLCYLSF